MIRPGAAPPDRPPVLGPALVLAALVLAAGAGCTREFDPSGGRDALLQADRDFAARTAERGADGWAEAFLEDGVMFPHAGRVDGREAIRRRMRIAFTPDRRLAWEPAEAVVSSGGDLGYTLGRWRTLVRAVSGDSIVAEGNYVTVWRKDAQGVWRVAVDIGNTDAEP